jgi:phytoene dehydrogenase-like protein
VGAGHNGLVAACYLARAGLDVEVVERDTVVGGAVSTVERWPGVRVDRGSSIHVMVRQTDLVEDLGLQDVGLEYDDVDPFIVVPDPRAPLRFSSDLTATLASISTTCGRADADAYRQFVTDWSPRTRWFLDAGSRPPSPRALGRAAIGLVRGESGSRAEMVRDFMQPAEALVASRFDHPMLRATLNWWAAQSGPPPHAVGTAPIAGSLTMFHDHKAGRPRGGSGRLSDALAERFTRLGGTLRVGDPVVGITTGRRPVVRTTSGDRIEARVVVAACHVGETMHLLGDRDARRQLRIGSGLGMVVRLLTNQLPTYRTDIAGAGTAMQFLVRSSEQIRAAYGDFLRGEPAADPPLIVMTPTAADATLAPAGRHVVSVWAQWHPYQLRDGTWDGRRDEVADGIVAGVESWAPGFQDSVVDRFVQTPLDLERELGLINGNVMHVEGDLDAMFTLRPLPSWSGYRSPHRGIYLCGASTHPGGGVWGASGRAAAEVVLRDLRLRRFGLGGS